MTAQPLSARLFVQPRGILSPAGRSIFLFRGCDLVRGWAQRHRSGILHAWTRASRYGLGRRRCAGAPAPVSAIPAPPSASDHTTPRTASPSSPAPRRWAVWLWPGMSRRRVASPLPGVWRRRAVWLLREVWRRRAVSESRAVSSPWSVQASEHASAVSDAWDAPGASVASDA